MSIFISVIIATIIFGGRIFYLERKRRKGTEMYPVEAGHLDDVVEDFSKPILVNTFDLRRQMDKELTYFIVKNDCMTPKHICNNDFIGVRMFNNEFTIDHVQKGDILLIWIKDEKWIGHKIRIKGDFDGAQSYKTFYYKDGKTVRSSQNHRVDSIKGVVEEVIHSTIH